VAVWPAFTSPTSDSLSGTTSCIELRLLSTANDALEEPEDPEPAVDEEVPVPVAPVPVPALLDVALLLVLLVEAFVVPVAETVSPISPESATIVPSSGA
jgi:hypothetical protein